MAGAKLKKPIHSDEHRDVLVTTNDLAAIFGVNSTAIRELRTRGIIEADGLGNKFPLAKSCRAYILYLKQGVTNPTAPRLAEQRARLAKLQSDKAELALLKEQGDLTTRPEVEAKFGAAFRALRARLLAVVSRYRTMVPKTTAAEADLLDRELRDALTEIANWEKIPDAA